MDDLIATLRAERYRLGWSLTDLETKSGISKMQLNKWETGAVLPTVPSLHMWATALGKRLTLADGHAAEPRLCGHCKCKPVGKGRHRYCSTACARAVMEKSWQAAYEKRKASQAAQKIESARELDALLRVHIRVVADLFGPDVALAALDLESHEEAVAYLRAYMNGEAL